MGCLKAGTVAQVVIPTPDYVRFATHYGFSPDFCHPRDPASKGIVENLVGYAKRDIPTPDTDTDLAVWNRAAARWCTERNRVEHSEICAVPADRLVVEAGLLRPLPGARPRIGRAEIRKVDKLATIRVASARYSVPSAQRDRGHCQRAVARPRSRRGQSGVGAGGAVRSVPGR
jgi:hypothetical protein